MEGHDVFVEPDPVNLREYCPHRAHSPVKLHMLASQQNGENPAP